MTDRAQLDRWMALAADGDRASIDPLFHALWPVVVDYARKLVGNDADDCAQDALVKLFGQLAHYDRSRDALAWALTLTTWECRTARRKVHRRAVRDVPADDASLDGASLDGTAIVEERELVRAALLTLASLAPRDVEVILASISDDDSVRAMLEPATFRKRLERALSRLRMSWRSRHGAL